MSVDPQLLASYRFMRANAGYVVGENAKGALDLARAEQLLERAVDLEVASLTWEWDDDPYDAGDLSDEEAQAKFDSNEWTGPFGCIVQTDDAVASLWSIVVGQRGTNDPYCRVVAAELALELADDLRQSIGDYLDEHVFVYAPTYEEAMEQVDRNRLAAEAIGRA